MAPDLDKECPHGPKAPNGRQSLDDPSDLDYAYFASTYRPLSNLPTPPPSSSRHSAGPTGFSLDLDHAEMDALLGPAVHLVNMLPPCASLATPSVSLVQAMLARAALPLDTIAFAVCILDALDVRFSRVWRLTCPGADDADEPESGHVPDALHRPQPHHPHHQHHHSQPIIKRHTLPLLPLSSTTSTTSSPSTAATTPTTSATSALPTSLSSTAIASFSSFSSSFFARSPRHVDSVCPEIIILAALVIAAKFTDDGHAGQQAAREYCQWGGPSSSSPSSSSTSLWTPAQLAATERCVMQSLGYRILPLMDQDLLADARGDMHRAGLQHVAARRQAKGPTEADDEEGVVMRAKGPAALLTPSSSSPSLSAASSPIVEVDKARAADGRHVTLSSDGFRLVYS